ncbi:hypothetical protein V1277_005812 [Bradyrhizobium sp. AZCC 1588]
MANAQILHVFQGDKRQSRGFPVIRLPGIEAVFPKIGQPGGRLIEGSKPRAEPQGPAGPLRRQTVSNRSMTSVSARPARVHSWNAGNDVIASK